MQRLQQLRRSEGARAVALGASVAVSTLWFTAFIGFM